MHLTCPRSPCRRPAWLDATLLLVVSWIAVAAMALQIRPGAEVVAVAFPPWWSTQQAIAAAASANAAIVRLTALPSLLVVRPEDSDGVARLRRAGAWFAVDPQAVAGCFGSTRKD
jgi:hypothetical protein